MSGHRLRQAATKLREAVEYVYDYPELTAEDMYTVTHLGIRAIVIHPDVAIMLADWLDEHETVHSIYRCDFRPCGAVALADAILDEATTDPTTESSKP